MAPSYTRLVADIGGTNARFALLDADGRPTGERKLPVADYADPGEAALAYLDGRRVDRAVFAVATPVEGDAVAFTNSPWRFSIRAVEQRLGLRRLAVINDFAAQAWSIPSLSPDDFRPLKPGTHEAERPAVVIGPGTGLGVAFLIQHHGAPEVLPSEGGHVSFAPTDPVQAAVLEVLAARFGHVSVERLASGPGLVNIVQALAQIHGTPITITQPPEVSAGAADGACPLCVEALRIFATVLGAAAGNFALTLRARGGVYLVGGISRNLGPLLDRDAFVAGFLHKGRFRDYLDPVAVTQVMRPHTGLYGAAVYPLPDD